MKIIDFERKGNIVRFFLGADDRFNYWGDDSFSKFVGADGIQRFYFEDHMEPDENT